MTLVVVVVEAAVEKVVAVVQKMRKGLLMLKWVVVVVVVAVAVVEWHWLWMLLR